MQPLLLRLRFYILASSAILALILASYAYLKYGFGDQGLVKLVQYYALTCTFYLYAAVIASPLYVAFPRLPFRPYHIRARRALGVSAFFFGLLHASFAFFGTLGGFPGLFFLSSDFLWAIEYSFTALIILSLMAATSFDKLVNRLGRNWKRLHRLVYVAVTLVLVHALQLGTHFIDLSGLVPIIFFWAVLVLYLLESWRLYVFFTRYSFWIRFVFVTVWSLASSVLLSYILFEDRGTTGFSIHNNHEASLEDTAPSTNDVPDELWYDNFVPPDLPSELPSNQ